MAAQLRHIKTKNLADFSSDAIIRISYIQQNSIKLNQLEQRENLIKFFQLLAYTRTLKNYEIIDNRRFRKFLFPVCDFMRYIASSMNQHQLEKTTEFCEYLKHNLVFENFEDDNYKMLVVIPLADVQKKSNKWISEVWVADDYYSYFEPLIFPDFFKRKKMAIDEFLVLFELVHRFHNTQITTQLDIEEFLQSSQVNKSRKKRMKEFFLKDIREL